MLEGLLNENWLGEVLAMFVTLIIFTIGLTSFLYQITIHEDVRRIFLKRTNVNFNNTIFTLFFLFLFSVLILTNQGVIFSLKKLFPDSHFEIIWYSLICLLLGFLFFKIASLTLNKNIFPKDFHFFFLDLLFKQVWESYKKNNLLQTTDINDIFIYAETYGNNNLRLNQLLENTGRLVDKIMSHDKYQGNNLSQLIYLIREISKKANEKNTSNALEIYSKIWDNSYFQLEKQSKSEDLLKNQLYLTDLDHKVHATLGIGIQALEKSDSKSIQRVTDILFVLIRRGNFLLELESKEFLSIYKRKVNKIQREAAFQFYSLSKLVLKNHDFKSIAIVFAKLRLENFNKDNQIYLIGLIAWFASINDITFQEAKKRFRSFKLRAKKSELKKAEKLFLSMGEYDTVQKIRDFTNKYYLKKNLPQESILS